MLATIVDTSALWQTVVYALVSAVGVTLIFSLAIRGATRFGEHSRDGRPFAAGVSGGLAILGLLATATAIVVAVIVMTTK